MKDVTPSNCLTISRLCLAPILLPWSIMQPLGSSVYILSALAITDYLDGLCARIWRQETWLGAWLDPLADKVLLASVVFPLVALHVVHWSVALLFIVREFVVLAARHVAALAHITISVSKWGKCKTMLQFAYLALCLIPDVPEVAYARWVMLIAAVVASVGSMLTYVYRLVCRMP